MIEIHAVNKKLSKLFFDSTGKYPKNIIKLPESGSHRMYFRLQCDKISLIGTYNTVFQENKAFVSFAKHFASMNLPVPKILNVSETGDCYLQSDLGDLSLYNLVEKSLENGGFHESLIDFYQDALTKLIDFQVIGNRNLDYSVAYPVSSFDKKAILDDLAYFKYFFLKIHPEIVYNESKLDVDFEKLTDFILEAPSNYFMYRDFQTRNIMVHDGSCVFIDFQGGRRGPLQYDLVSILYQVKAQMPQKVRDVLHQYYLRELSLYVDPEELEFEKYFPAFVFLRLMQVLGAYGFRGIVQRKKHFIESIPYALQEIDNQLSLLKLPVSLPELKGIFQQLSYLKKQYPIKKELPKQGLTVTVNSFSFKENIPEDESGNGGGFIFDCRALPNPGRYPKFQLLTGKDQEVIDFLSEKKEIQEFIKNSKAIISQSVVNYIERDFKSLMIGFGCTGGQHRSVFCAERITEWLKKEYPKANVVCSHHSTFMKR